MKLLSAGIGVAAAGLSIAIAVRAEMFHAERDLRAGAGCLVRTAPSPGRPSRATLVVENRRPEAVRIWLEARAGWDLARTDFGIVGPRQSRTAPNAIPARRNGLSAVAAREAGDPRFVRGQTFHVANRRPDTCARRFAWPLW